jgi:peptidoglycan/xylan/chitin deacetylase (PgdA/CDA1 family)
MSTRMLLAAILLVSAAGQTQAQFAWPKGKVAALALTYDDALHSQLEVAIPQLDAAGFKGTFFLDGDITPADMLRWRMVQRAGHELGNHTLFHPCPRAMLPDRNNYFTENYDGDRLLAEIGVMNNVLFGIDGQGKRTYSVPCSQMLLGDGPYTEALRRSGLVKYVRTGGDQYKSVVTDFANLDVFQVPSYGPWTSLRVHSSSPTRCAFAMRRVSVYCSSTARVATTSKSPPRRINSSWTGCGSIPKCGSRRSRRSWIT